MFSHLQSSRLTRRGVLRAGALLAGVSAVPLLAACSGSAATPTAAATALVAKPTTVPTTAPAQPTTAPTAAASPTAAATAAPTTAAAASPTTAAASPTVAAAANTTPSSISTKFFTATSTKSFANTVSALKTAVSGAGMMVLGTLNQAGALSVAGLQLKGAETFFIGNPSVGKMFFQADPAIGAVLPLRLYTWVNDAGKAEVGYFDPVSLMTAVDPHLADQAQKLAMAAAKVTQAATGAAPAPSATVNAQFVTVSSSKSFTETVNGLKTSTSSAGMMVLGQLNQAGALSMTGLHLAGAQSFFVGNPTTGKMFFQTDPAIGIVIPVGMYVWVNSAGKTEIGYFDPGPLMAGINPKLTKPGQQLSQMAAKITQGAA